MWNGTAYNSEKCTNYRMFKTEFGFERYFNMLPCKYWIPLCKLRLSSHCLPIEQGRYTNVNRYERYCTVCNSDNVGDEYHFLFECNSLSELRNKYIPCYYYRRPITIKSIII